MIHPARDPSLSNSWLQVTSDGRRVLLVSSPLLLGAPPLNHAMEPEAARQLATRIADRVRRGTAVSVTLEDGARRATHELEGPAALMLAGQLLEEAAIAEAREDPSPLALYLPTERGRA